LSFEKHSYSLRNGGEGGVEKPVASRAVKTTKTPANTTINIVFNRKKPEERGCMKGSLKK